MRRALRWVVRGVLGIISLVVIALVAVLIAIHTDWGRNLIRAQVVEVLRGTFPGGAKIAKLDGSVFGTLAIRGVELDGRDGKPWVTVGTIELRAALLPLIWRRIHIDSVVIDDVAIDQRTERPSPIAETSNESSGWQIEVSRAEVHRANARIVTQTRTFDLHELELNAAASLDRGVITAVVGLHGKWDDRDLAVAGTVHVDRGAISAPFFAAELGQAHACVLGLRIGDVIAGVVAAFVPAAAGNALAQLHLPGDIAVVASTSADGALDVHGAIGDATLRVVGHVSRATRTANAVLFAEVPDGSSLDPRFAGRALVSAALSGGSDGVRGMVAIEAARPFHRQLLGNAEVSGAALLAIDATPATAWVLLESRLDVGETRATAVAELARARDGAVTLIRSTLDASAHRIGARAADVEVATLRAHASAAGRLLPAPAVDVSAVIDGDSLRYGTLSAASLAARFTGRELSRADLHVDVGNVRADDRLLGSASIDVRASRHGNGTVDIAIDQHSIATAANGTWAGSGGHVTIEPTRIVVSDLHTGSGTGSVVANATIDRAGSGLRGDVTANNVALATLAPGIAGTIDGTLAFERRGTSWKGNGQLAGRGVVVQGQAPMDLDVALELDGGRIHVATTATAPAGKLIVAADVDGPHDITDGTAWKRLDRKAVHGLSITVDHVDLARVGASGTVTGKLDITDAGASGDLALHGLATKLGSCDADLLLGPDTRGPVGLLAQVTAKLAGVDAVTALAQLDVPARPFDPAQWRSLGRRALHHASITLVPLDFDPSVLARVHLDQPYRGHLEAEVDISEGVGSVTAKVAVTKLRGGVIVAPIDVRVEADVTDRGAHATGTIVASEAGPGTNAEATHTLVTLAASSPITLAGAGRDALRSLPLSGTIAIPQVPAPQIEAVLGRHDVSRGVVDGTIELGGTIGRPTGALALTASRVTVQAGALDRAPAQLDSLEVDGRWDGAAGELAISGREASGGTVEVAATGRPDQLDGLVATVHATKLDLAPFAAFAVGPVSAARGTLDTSLEIHGVDPRTGQVAGHVDLHDGRLPVAPQFGTLQQANVHVVIASHEVDATLTAKLGKGDLKGTAKATLVGSTPARATAKLELHQISIVGALQPTIDATIDAELAHDTAWRATVAVHHGHLAAATGGVALLPTDVPSEIQFTDQAPSSSPPAHGGRQPARPWLIATVDLEHTGFEVAQAGFEARGDIAGKLRISVGDGIGMDGTLDATAQNIALLGTRVQLDHASATWDGTVDPMLDVSAVRELSDLTVTAKVTGRLSQPKLALSSDRGSYTQAGLIAVFLSGAPSTDRSEVNQTAAAVGAGAASALVTSQLRRAAPGWASKLLARVSVNYEVATSASSEALRVGYWIREHVFLAVRSRLDPLPDENSNEAIGEWHFRTDTMLQGVAGDRGTASLDVVQRWRW